MIPTWDILIATLPHRHAELVHLLSILDAQIGDTGAARVLLYRDNLEASYGAKTQVLLNYSDADYVCCLDDDDEVAPDYVDCIRSALEGQPDYVGFMVKYTVDGVPQLPVIHSLACGGWNKIDDAPEILERDIVQFNPIRRELALLGTWEGGWQADYRWASQVRATGQVCSEVFIAEELYWKLDKSGKDFRQGHQPWTGPMPELPSYPWLVVL